MVLRTICPTDKLHYILLQLPASDKRLEETPIAQKEHPICKISLRIVRREGQTRFKSFQACSVHTGSQETRFPRDMDFFSKALVSLLRHRLDWKSWTGFTMGIKELLSVVAQPRNRFGGQVWANNWKRWSLTVTKVLSIEDPTWNQWYPLQFQKDHGRFSEPTCSVLTGGHTSWWWIISRASSKYQYCWRPRKWNDTRIKVHIRQTRNTQYLEVWQWATIRLNVFLTSSQRITRLHMWRQAKSCRKPTARRSEPYTDKECIKERKRPS